MEDGGHADRATEVSRIAAEGEQRVGGRAKQQRVDDARIALTERVFRSDAMYEHATEIPPGVVSSCNHDELGFVRERRGP